MDINLKKNKHSLAHRLTVIQVAMVILVSVSIIISCWIILDQYVLKRSQFELQKSSEILAELLSNSNVNGFWVDAPLQFMRRLPFQSIKTHFIIVNNDNLIIGSTLGNVFTVGNILPKEISLKLQSSQKLLQYKGYLFAFTPIFNSKDQITGHVIALSAQTELVMIRRTIFWLLIRILIVVGIIGFFFSTYLTQRVVKPLQDLKLHANKISERDFSSKIENISDDELGDLARAFNVMGDKLYQYNLAQTRFVQNASHELKSPLMSIQGYAEGLEEGIFSQQEKKEAIHVIIEESQRLKKVVEELLYLSKVESNSSYLDIDEVALSDLVNAACQIVYSKFKHNNLELLVDIPESLMLPGSYNHLVRALANVLDNAGRYAHQQVKIHAYRDNTSVIITVTDDGIGFSEEDIEHVFERFYKGKGGDTGLGMAITRDIIHAHQGHIQISNALGNGAMVTFVLPLASQLLDKNTTK